MIFKHKSASTTMPWQCSKVSQVERSRRKKKKWSTFPALSMILFAKYFHCLKSSFKQQTSIWVIIHIIRIMILIYCNWSKNISLYFISFDVHFKQFKYTYMSTHRNLESHLNLNLSENVSYLISSFKDIGFDRLGEAMLWLLLPLHGTPTLEVRPGLG